MASTELGREETQVPQQQLIRDSTLERSAYLCRRPDSRARGSKGSKAPQESLCVLSRSAIGLQDEGHEDCVLSTSTRAVLADLCLLGNCSNPERPGGCTSHIGGRGGVDYRDVNVSQCAAERKADVSVLIIGVMELETGLHPGTAACLADHISNRTCNRIVTTNGLTGATRVREGVVGVMTKGVPAVAMRRHDVNRRVMCPHARS